MKRIYSPQNKTPRKNDPSRYIVIKTFASSMFAIVANVEGRNAAKMFIKIIFNWNYKRARHQCRRKFSKTYASYLKVLKDYVIYIKILITYLFNVYLLIYSIIQLKLNNFIASQF